MLDNEFSVGLAQGQHESVKMDSQFGVSKIKTALHTYIGFKFANLVLAFVFQIVVVKTLPPGQYATFAVLLAILTAGERLLSFGLDRTTMRFVPTLAQRGDGKRLRGVIGRILAIRLGALSLFAGICVIATGKVGGLLPTKVDTVTLVAFVIWFLSFTLMADADAFAQSFLAHSDSAVASFVEISVRTLATIGVALLTVGGVSANTIVFICTTTSTVAVICLIVRLARFRSVLERPAPEGVFDATDPTFEPRQAPGFAIANYASTIVYLISSPPVIRIVASAGLGVVTLAAFSFIQTLALAVQRMLPGLLVLPTLEPIIMSRILGRDSAASTLSALSLVFKLELSCILCGLIVTVISGSDFIAILSRQEYAIYANILIVMLIYVILATSYRLLEMIVNTNFQHRVFYAIWPLSFMSLVATYLTVQRIGLSAVLFFPTLEIGLRVFILAVVFRRYGTLRLFDPLRTLPLIASAGAIAALGALALGLSGFEHSKWMHIGVAAVAAVLFLVSIAVLKVLRPSEHAVIETAFPKRWLPALAIIRLGVRG